jgi:hypothetical protein
MADGTDAEDGGNGSIAVVVKKLPHAQVDVRFGGNTDR